MNEPTKPTEQKSHRGFRGIFHRSKALSTRPNAPISQQSSSVDGNSTTIGGPLVDLSKENDQADSPPTIECDVHEADSAIDKDAGAPIPQDQDSLNTTEGSQGSVAERSLKEEAANDEANDKNLWELARDLLNQELKTREILEDCQQLIDSEVTALNQEPKKRRILKDCQQLIDSEVTPLNGSLIDQVPITFRPEELQAFASNQLAIAKKKAEIKFSLGEHNFDIRNGINHVIKGVVWAKDFIGGALPADPYVSTAWTGICLLLPLLLNPLAQEENAVAGVETITHLVCRASVVDEQFKNFNADTEKQLALVKDFKENRIKVYSSIIYFEALLVCHLSHPKLRRYLSDVGKHHDWAKIVKCIETSLAKTDLSWEEIFKVKLFQKFEDLDATLGWNFEKLLKGQENILEQSRKNQESEANREIKKILLNSLDYVGFKNDTNPPKIPGTGKWLLKDTNFVRWNETKTSSLLLLTADPGCGKSVLARSLIDHDLDSGSATICYFFFKDLGDKDKGTQKMASNALCAILHQLFTNKKTSHLIQYAKADYDDGVLPLLAFDTLWKILEEVVKDPTAGTIICVLDALDECGASQLDKLTKKLQTFYSLKPSDASGTLKFVLTSRPYDHIKQPFKNLRSLFVEGEQMSDMMKSEINLVIKQKLKPIAARFGKSWAHKLKKKLDKTTAKYRTFLWVSLVFKEIDRLTEYRSENKDHVYDVVIDHIPSSVFGAYTLILGRVEDDIRDWVRKVLGIIIAATQPLHLDELKVAVNIKKGTKAAKNICCPCSTEEFRHLLLGRCHFFITIVNSRVYLIHQTAKEYLLFTNTIDLDTLKLNEKAIQWQHTFIKEKCHSILAEACMNYLFLDCFGTNVSLDISESGEDTGSEESDESGEGNNENDDESNSSLSDHDEDESDGIIHESSGGNGEAMSTCELDEDDLIETVMDNTIICGLHRHFRHNIEARKRSTAQYAFLWYAARNWPLHFRNCDSSNQFLQDGIRLCKSNTLRYQIWLEISYPEFRHFWKSSVLMVASFLGLTAIVQNALDGKNDAVTVNEMDTSGLTALHYATMGNHRSIMKTLIGNNAYIDVQDFSGETPLHIAVKGSQPDAVRLLLEHKAGLEIQNGDERTPLQYAVFQESSTILRILLENEPGANPNVGRIETNVPVEKIRSNPPILDATTYGYFENCELLIKHGARIDFTTQDGENLAFVAAADGNRDIVELFIRKGLDPKVRDKDGKTALITAVCHKQVESLRGVYKSLFEYLVNGLNIEINARDNVGRSALFYAEESFVYHDLVALGADENIVDEKGETAAQVILKDWGIEV